MNVKFTTGEKMGFVGREEGAAALAVATLEPIGRLGGGRMRERRRRAAAAARSCSCSTWRLSCCSERRRCPRTVGAEMWSASQPQMPAPATP